MEVSTQEGPQTRYRMGSVKVPFMRPDTAASKIPKPTTELLIMGQRWISP
jgi:hypothetical protein